MKVNNSLIVIVTGGALGLGKATVQMLTKMKAKVIIADILQNQGSNTANLFKCDFFKLNLAQQEQVKSLFQFTISKYDKIDVVIHCAAIFYQGQIIIPDKQNKISVDSSQNFSSLLKINVIGTFNIDKWAAKYMASQELNQNQQRGLIINVASISGFQGSAGHTAYSSTKGAILGMSLPLARDLGKYKIRVMTIAPGLFHTRMTSLMSKQLRKLNENSTPLNRFGEPAQFAKLIISVIQTPFATGSVWKLDGGFRVPYL